MNNETFKTRNNGHSHPNVALIQKRAKGRRRLLRTGGVGEQERSKTILLGIEVDLWALTTLVNLEFRGYVHVGS